jgi:hypothetical protein
VADQRQSPVSSWILAFLSIAEDTFDRPWNEISMKIQTENFFGMLISTRLV